LDILTTSIFCGSGPCPAIKNVCHYPGFFEGETADNLRISAFLFS
jgi:hypothetical protein